MEGYEPREDYRAATPFISATRFAGRSRRDSDRMDGFGHAAGGSLAETQNLAIDLD